MLAVGYYALVVLMIVLFAAGARAVRMRFVSYAGFTFVVGLFVQTLPGYYIATGESLPALSRGFDPEIYWIFVTFAITLPAGLLLGYAVAGDMRLTMRPRASLSARMLLVLCGIVAYGLLYFRWLGDIPLNAILLGSHDLLAAVVRRVEITHQLGQMTNLPVVFRYWRVVLQLFLLIVFLYYLQYLRHGTLNRLILVALFGFLTYAALFTLEKGPYLYTLVALFLFRAERGLRPLTVLTFGVLGIAVVYLMYLFFMGANVDTWYLPLLDAGSRLSAQSGSVYVQVEYVRAHDFLWLRGLDLQFARRLIDNDYIDLSVWSYAQLSPEYSAMGVVGAAGGNAFAQLYFMFSWLAVPLFLAFVTAYAFLDRVASNTLEAGQLDPKTRMIVRSFYVALIPFTAIAFVGSVFSIFGVPTVLNSAYMFVLFFFALFVRLTSVRLLAPSYMIRP